MIWKILSEAWKEIWKAFIFTLRMLFMIGRFALPWIFRVIWATLIWWTTCFVAIFRGLPMSTKMIADYWFKEAVERGFPTLYDTQLYHVLRGTAYLTIVFGWITMSASTVILVRLCFEWIW